MATITGVDTDLARGCKSFTWTAFHATGNGTPFDAFGYPDKTVQVFGTWVSGGDTITIQGSNASGSGGTYNTLTDPQGNALTFTTAGIELIAESPRWIRPIATSVASTGVDLDVIIIARGTQT